MRKLISRQLGFRLNDLLKGTSVFEKYKCYLKIFSWSRSDVLELQTRKMKEILRHAYQSVPFYQKRFEEHNLTPDSFSKIDDLNKLPPLNRQDIQNHYNDLISVKADEKNMYRGSSSGSTGEPVRYCHDKNTSSWGWAALYFAWAMNGWKFGDKGLHIWGNPTTIQHQWGKWSSRIKSMIINQVRFPAYTLSDGGKFDEIVSLLYRNGFSYIDGYTNAIYLLSKYIEETGIKLKKKLLVFTTGENLQNFQRESIENSIGPVFDCYGCGEIMGIAYEIRKRPGYQVMDPHVIVEFDEEGQKNLDNSKPLIITDLDNYSFPLIRYKNGDLAIPSPGQDYSQSPFTSFKEIIGRSSDIITLPSGGNLVVPSFFGSKLLRLVKGIKQYQVVKVSENKLIVKLVTDNDFKDRDLQTINESLKEYLGENISWAIELMDNIDSGKSGKFKLIVDKTIGKI